MLKLEVGKIYNAVKGTRCGVSKKGNPYGMLVISDGFWSNGSPKNPLYIWVDNIDDGIVIKEGDDFEVTNISAGGPSFEYYKDKDGNRIERNGKKGETKITFNASVKPIQPLGDIFEIDDDGELPFEMPGDTTLGELPL